MSHVLVITSRRYNGHELWTALIVMQERGHTFEVVSTGKTIRDEKTKKANTIERLVYDVTPKELEKFNGLLVISGNPQDTEAYWTDKHVKLLVETADDLKQGIGGICAGVPTVRYAAKGKRVSFFPLAKSRELLMRAEAILTTLTLSVDDRLVTAEHQMATEMWAEEFCNVLEGKATQYKFVDSGYTPGVILPEHRIPKELRYVRKVAKRSKDRAD